MGRLLLLLQPHHDLAGEAVAEGEAVTVDDREERATEARMKGTLHLGNRLPGNR